MFLSRAPCATPFGISDVSLLVPQGIIWAGFPKTSTPKSSTSWLISSETNCFGGPPIAKWSYVCHQAIRWLDPCVTAGEVWWENGGFPPSYGTFQDHMDHVLNQHPIFGKHLPEHNRGQSQSTSLPIMIKLVLATKMWDLPNWREADWGSLFHFTQVLFIGCDVFDHGSLFQQPDVYHVGLGDHRSHAPPSTDHDCSGNQTWQCETLWEKHLGIINEWFSIAMFHYQQVPQIIDFCSDHMVSFST